MNRSLAAMSATACRSAATDVAMDVIVAVAMDAKTMVNVWPKAWNGMFGMRESLVGLNEDQIAYMRNVLGLRGVLLPEGLSSASASSADPRACPAPVFSDSSEISGVRPRPGSRVRTSGDPTIARLMVLLASRDDHFVLEGEAKDLAQKMLRAIKIPAPDLFWAEWTRLENGCPDEIKLSLDTKERLPVLVFGLDTLKSVLAWPAEENLEPILGLWSRWRGIQLLPTYRLEDILKRAELKRPAWAHLQAVMKVLGSKQ